MERALLFLLAFFYLGACDQCEDGWQFFGQSCYNINNTNVDMFTAMRMCMDNNISQIVRIDSSEENEFVQNLVRDNGLSAVWLGVMKFDTWVEIPDVVDQTYFDWKDEFPKADDNLTCALMDDTGKWKNEFCAVETLAAVICETL